MHCLLSPFVDHSNSVKLIINKYLKKIDFSVGIHTFLLFLTLPGVVIVCCRFSTQFKKL